MNNLLIISPYFPPSNAADMQRIRMSLRYFESFGWEAEVVTVGDRHSDINKDILLLDSVPSGIERYEVDALSKKYTSKLGLGSIALRSLIYYKKTVNQLLRRKRYDLIYFSTTQFPVCILGSYWKKKFGVPYVIDMQDPWHSEYYQDKPKNERPPKYWFSYRLNKFLEPIAMKEVDGLISVSAAYIQTLKERYPQIRDIPSSVITFGAFEKDFEIAAANEEKIPTVINKEPGTLSIAYVGRGGKDMQPAVRLFFEAFREGQTESKKEFEKFRFFFIGTSYASAGQGKASIRPLAEEMELQQYVEERTDRIPFYQTLNTLKSADLLFIPGSDDPQYTASKIYPYLMAEKPLVSIFNPASSAAKIIRECEAGLAITFDMDRGTIKGAIKKYLISVADGTVAVKPPKKEVFEQYSAKNMTCLQVELFEKVLEKKERQ